MQSIKRNLIDITVITAIVFAFALAWGSPFVSGSAARAQDQAQPQQQPGQDQGQNQAKTGTFTGTVVKSGDDYILKDSSGALYKLDDTERAKPFEGKAVKVTGQLDEQAKVIHVQDIEGAEG